MSASIALLAHTGLPARGLLDGVLHPLTGVDHLLAMVAVGVLAALAVDRGTAWRTPLAFLGGMVLGGAVGLAGVEVPAVEVTIAASVVVLGGAMVLIRSRWHPVDAGGRRLDALLPAAALVFGAMHGHAHGAELPDAAVPVLYVAGFVLATAALHVSGALAGVHLRQRPALRVGFGGAISAVGAVLLVGLAGI